MIEMSWGGGVQSWGGGREGGQGGDDESDGSSRLREGARLRRRAVADREGRAVRHADDAQPRVRPDPARAPALRPQRLHQPPPQRPGRVAGRPEAQAVREPGDGLALPARFGRFDRIEHSSRLGRSVWLRRPAGPRSPAARPPPARVASTAGLWQSGQAGPAAGPPAARAPVQPRAPIRALCTVRMRFEQGAADGTRGRGPDGVCERSPRRGPGRAYSRRAPRRRADAPTRAQRVRLVGVPTLLHVPIIISSWEYVILRPL